MNKLLKFREWLTLDEACLYISNELGESVTTADLYRLSLDGHLKLSINLMNNTHGITGKFVKAKDVNPDEIPYDRFTNDKSEIQYSKVTKSELYNVEDDWISFDDKVVLVSGIWDLTMLGAERLDIEHEYQQATSGIEITLMSFEGVILQQGDIICQLQTAYDDVECVPGSQKAKKLLDQYISDNELTNQSILYLQNKHDEYRKIYIDNRKNKSKEDNYFPSGGLDGHDYSLVLKTREVTRFIQSLEDTSLEKTPFIPDEKNSLLILIEALCKEANINIKQRGIVMSLVAMTELIGAPLGDDTVRAILKKINMATPRDKAVTPKRRTSSLVLIGALCKEVGVDWNHSGASASLVKMIESTGQSLNDDTINTILNKIESAISSKSR